MYCTVFLCSPAIKNSHKNTQLYISYIQHDKSIENCLFIIELESVSLCQSEYNNEIGKLNIIYKKGFSELLTSLCFFQGPCLIWLEKSAFPPFLFYFPEFYCLFWIVGLKVFTTHVNVNQMVKIFSFQ